MFVGLPAQIVCLGARRSGTLINISRTGAQVRLDDPPSKGSEVFLYVTTLQLFARVVWQNHEWCGLQFDEELGVRDLEFIHHEGASRGLHGAR